MRKTLIVGFLLTSVAATGMLADEGRVPIFQPTIVTQSGHYILTRDIAGGAGPVIAIQANDVTLDLNGRTISGGPIDALIMIADGFRGVTIRNGRLSGGSFGIYYASSTVGTRLRVENVEMTNSTHPIYVFGAELAYVLSCRVAGGDSDAIAVSGIADASYTGQFLNNVIEEVGGSAMSLGGLRAGLVRGNLVTHFGKVASLVYGILIGSGVASDQGGNIVEHNTVRGSDDDLGIAILAGPDNLVADNDVSGVGASGIAVTTRGNRIVGNVSGSNATGISASGSASGNVFERNHVENNRLNGISVDGDYNLVDGNVSEGNGQAGLSLSGAGNAYRNNMLRNNTGGSFIGVGTDAGGNIL